MKGLSTRASATCLLLCCCKIDFSPFLPHAHKRFSVPKPCVQGTDKLEEIRNWGMGAVVVIQVLSHPQSQTQQALSPRKKKNKNAKINLHRCPQVQTCHWILPFLYPSCVSKHHCTFALRTCPASHHESPELPALAAPRVCLWKAGAYLSPLSPAWSLAGKKIGTVLTSLQSQLRFGTQLLKSDMSMQGICAWKAKLPPAQGKFSIPFLSLCMRHSTFNSIPRDGNR